MFRSMIILLSILHSAFNIRLMKNEKKKTMCTAKNVRAGTARRGGRLSFLKQIIFFKYSRTNANHARHTVYSKQFPYNQFFICDTNAESETLILNECVSCIHSAQMNARLQCTKSFLSSYEPLRKTIIRARMLQNHNVSNICERRYNQINFISNIYVNMHECTLKPRAMIGRSK